MSNNRTCEEINRDRKKNRKWENGKNSLENGRSKFWFRIYCYYYWRWIDTPHYFINRHAEEKLQKSGRLEVYNLVQESNLVEFKISSEVFTETLFFFDWKWINFDQYTSNSWMFISTKRIFLGNRNWKGRYQGTISNFKMIFEMNLMNLKLNFKFKTFKDTNLKSFKDIFNTTSKSTGGQECIIISLLDIMFLKDQLRQKAQVMDSLIN